MHVEDLIRREGVRGQQGQPVKPSFSWKNGSVKSWYTTVSIVSLCYLFVQSNAQCYINKEASGRLPALSTRPIFANFTEILIDAKKCENMGHAVVSIAGVLVRMHWKLYRICIFRIRNLVFF